MPITYDVIEYINGKAEGNLLPDYDDESESSVSHDTTFLPIPDIALCEVVKEVVSAVYARRQRIRVCVIRY